MKKPYDDWVPNIDLWDSFDIVHAHKPLEQPPAPASYIIFKVGEKTYAKNCQTGQIEYNDPDATKVIQYGLDSLTSDRTWKEKVLVKGTYTNVGQIKMPSYSILELQGSIKAKAGLNTHLITNDNPTTGNTDITLIGGFYDANKENQTADMSCIHFEKVERPEVYFAKVRGGKRVSASHGEGICLWNCQYGKVVGNYCYEAVYDNIKVRGGSIHCLVANNTCVNSETKGGIQVSSEGTKYINVIGNVIHQQYHDLDNGIRIHAADNVLVEGNQIYCHSSAAIQLIDDARYNVIRNNNIITNTGLGIHTFGNTPSAARPSYNIFRDNTIVLLTSGGGIAISNGDYNEIEGNKIFGPGAGTGVSIGSSYASYNRLGPNSYSGLATNVSIPDGVDVEFINCMVFCGASYTAITGGTAQTFGVLEGKAACVNDEAQMRQIIAKGGIFRNAYLRMNVAPGSGETVHLIYRLNSADTPVDIVATGTAMEFNDRAHSLTCNPGDRIAVRITETSGVPTAHLQWAIQFLPF